MTLGPRPWGLITVLVLLVLLVLLAAALYWAVRLAASRLQRAAVVVRQDIRRRHPAR
jgi:hypothetical protein